MCENTCNITPINNFPSTFYSDTTYNLKNLFNFTGKLGSCVWVLAVYKINLDNVERVKTHTFGWGYEIILQPELVSDSNYYFEIRANTTVTTPYFTIKAPSN